MKSDDDLRIEALALAVEGRGLAVDGVAESPAATVERAKVFLDFLTDHGPVSKPGKIAFASRSDNLKLFPCSPTK